MRFHGAFFSPCYARRMGGSPRSPKKDGPSYEDGELRDPSIAGLGDEEFDGARLRALILRALRRPADTRQP